MHHSTWLTPGGAKQPAVKMPSMNSFTTLRHFYVVVEMYIVHVDA